MNKNDIGEYHSMYNSDIGENHSTYNSDIGENHSRGARAPIKTQAAKRPKIFFSISGKHFFGYPKITFSDIRKTPFKY